MESFTDSCIIHLHFSTQNCGYWTWFLKRFQMVSKVVYKFGWKTQKCKNYFQELQKISQSSQKFSQILKSLDCVGLINYVFKWKLCIDQLKVLHCQILEVYLLRVECFDSNELILFISKFYWKKILWIYKFISLFLHLFQSSFKRQ